MKTDPMRTSISRHEGTLIFATETEAPEPIIAAIVVVAVAGDVPGEMGLKWRVHGDPVHSVPTVARFLQINNAFAMAVQGALDMMRTGRLDGSYGGGCPIHGEPEPPPDDAPSPAQEGE